jgi:hypothetical protein
LCEEPLEEVRPVHHANVDDRGYSIIEDKRFSSWSRLQRSTARVLKSKVVFQTSQQWTKKAFLHSITDTPQLSDLMKTKKFLIRKAQWETFAKEIKFLEKR